MKRSRNIDAGIWGAALVIFFGGYFLGVQASPYFPLFVAFCMAYGAAVTAYWIFAKPSEQRPTQTPR